MCSDWDSPICPTCSCQGIFRRCLSVGALTEIHLCPTGSCREIFRLCACGAVGRSVRWQVALSQVESKVKDQVLEQQQREIQSLRLKLTGLHHPRGPAAAAAGTPPPQRAEEGGGEHAADGDGRGQEESMPAMMEERPREACDV